MFKKILLVLFTLVIPFILVSCVTNNEEDRKIPTINVEDIIDYEPGLFDIYEALGQELDADIERTYYVTSNGSNVSVKNGVFTVLRNNEYDVKVVLRLKDLEEIISFKVIAIKDEVPVDPNPDEIIIVDIPLANEMSGINYSFGQYKILSLNGLGVPTTVEDKFTLEYTIIATERDNVSQEAFIYFNGQLAGSEEANQIATIDANNIITFKTTGLIEIKVVSKEDETAFKSLLVNVNDGYNIYNSNQLHFALSTNDSFQRPINFQSDIIMEAGIDPFKSMFFSIKDEVLYGNNHVIDASDVSKVVYKLRKNDADRNLGVINFYRTNPQAKNLIHIENLDIIGNGVYNELHTNAPKDVLVGITIVPTWFGVTMENDPLLDQYDYLTRTTDDINVQISSKHNAYRHVLGNVYLSNVNVTNTLVGIKLQNIDKLHLKNVTSTNSFLHNIEVYQVVDGTFENTKLGFSGGAAMELKEDFSKIYKYEMAIPRQEDGNMDHIAHYGNKPFYLPANAYDANTIINDYGFMEQGLVLLLNGEPKLITELTPNDQPIYVLKRPEGDYITDQTIKINGTFDVNNLTVGNESYYMNPSGGKESSAHLILKLKELYTDRVITKDGVESINYAIALITWGKNALNHTKVIIADETKVNFSPVPLVLADTIPDAGGWASTTSSYFYINKPVK